MYVKFLKYKQIVNFQKFRYNFEKFLKLGLTIGNISAIISVTFKENAMRVAFRILNY